MIHRDFFQIFQGKFAELYDEIMLELLVIRVLIKAYKLLYMKLITTLLNF
jgi:hypothetical protein